MCRGRSRSPWTKLAGRLDELPRGREIVAFCRGQFCVLSAEAVKLLRENGFTANYSREGVNERRMRGAPLETASE